MTPFDSTYPLGKEYGIPERQRLFASRVRRSKSILRAVFSVCAISKLLGNASFIPNYTDPSNFGVFRLADDIERMPETRLKIPMGARLNMYLNDRLTLRTFYRYYYDDWCIQAHTASVELPIKLSMKWTVYPSYRYYQQTQATYFKPFGEHLSTEQFYTSDNDLYAFDSQQLGFGISYKDLFTNFRALGFGLKNIDFRFQHYYRSDGLESIIYGLGVKFVQ